MQTYLHGRDMIGDLDFSKEEVETVMDVAFDLKRKRALNEPHPYLRDKVLAMLFFFSSTRTRGSFEAGMAQLGGHAAFIESKTTQIAHGDTPKEIGEIFGRYFDGIAIRHCDWVWVTAILMMLPNIPVHQSLICSATSTTHSNAWQT
jgi:ornithine carbamoyltransferase